eukprot:295545-Amphidinium_carterae.1
MEPALTHVTDEFICGFCWRVAVRNGYGGRVHAMVGVGCDGEVRGSGEEGVIPGGTSQLAMEFHAT